MYNIKEDLNVKTLKVMSIIGIVFFSLAFFIIVLLLTSNPVGASGWGIISLFYAIPYSIVVLVISNKGNANTIDIANQLVKLDDLRQKEIITEEEFNQKKSQLLKKKL